MSDIDREEFDEVKRNVGKLATDVEVMKGDLKTLKQNEHDAKGERHEIHNTLEQILKTINQRIGAERVKAGIRRWGWDAVKVFVGGVIGWLVKVFSG